MSTPWHDAMWWPDADGKHAWLSHDCKDQRETSMLPWPKWKITDSGIWPSVQCDACGMHVVLSNTFMGKRQGDHA